ncbi:Scr1 family TA system antitoxin-like transcriptional regulator [Lentzea sp. E54]|uniref:Scr1 family TA system antitoxin-like transcriptional regulator n=1 Tax=Lentzea xerophila TaxID=3435883 RepID=UPI003DA29430
MSCGDCARPAPTSRDTRWPTASAGTPSKVSTIEHGKARPSEIDLVQFLTMCGKDIDFFEDFKRRYRNVFDEYIVQVPDNVRTLAMAESTAKTMLNYDTLTVPGLIQTERYADALYRAAGLLVLRA